ncbi:MAG: hypothetical protein PHC46_03795, partial [Clostridia bacterium]|nr:hypothetical protein [Clostridia bacterium]
RHIVLLQVAVGTSHKEICKGGIGLQCNHFIEYAEYLLIVGFMNIRRRYQCGLRTTKAKTFK